jgi:hypothetical protein
VCWTFFRHLQGVPKVLEAFVFKISSKSLGAQKKYYCQIKAEILEFMWVCGKSRFKDIITLWHPNEKIVRFSPFSTIFFLLVNFGEDSQRATLNTLPPTVHRLRITGGAQPQPQLNQFPAITAALFRFHEQLRPITHFTQKGQKRRIFSFWCHDVIFWPN